MAEVSGTLPFDVVADELGIPYSELPPLLQELKIKVVWVDNERRITAPGLDLLKEFDPAHYYTFEETLRRLKVTENKLKRWVSEGEIPASWRFALNAPESGETPKPQLPTTGASLSIAFAAGLALLVGGMTVIVAGKRRKAIDH